MGMQRVVVGALFLLCLRMGMQRVVVGALFLLCLRMGMQRVVVGASVETRRARFNDAART
jgi:hypothetical protein